MQVPESGPGYLTSLHMQPGHLLQRVGNLFASLRALDIESFDRRILGILGIATLGFYVDSAFADLRFDRALFLILITAMLNICVDAISRTIRNRLRLQTTLEER